MNPQAVTVLIAIIALVLIIWLLIKLTKKVSPMNKQESVQFEINKRASEPTYITNKEKKGCGFWIIFLIVVIAIILGLLLAYSGKFNFHI